MGLLDKLRPNLRREREKQAKKKAMGGPDLTLVRRPDIDALVAGQMMVIKGDTITWSDEPPPATSATHSGTSLTEWAKLKRQEDEMRAIHEMEMQHRRDRERYEYIEKLGQIERELREMEEAQKPPPIDHSEWPAVERHPDGTMTMNGVEMERYQDPEGRWMIRPKAKPNEPPKEPPKPEVVHKAGHFPVEWMVEAASRANESDDFIRIEIEERAVVIFGMAGDTYADHRVEWLAMEKAQINPLVLAIENVERQIRVQLGLKAANG